MLLLYPSEFKCLAEEDIIDNTEYITKTYCDGVSDKEVKSISSCFQLVPIFHQVNIGVRQQEGKDGDQRKNTIRPCFTFRFIFSVCLENQEK